MIIHSEYTPKQYCLALKEQMESHFNFGEERFTGLILGRFFYVTHHCHHEWNRRITAEKNTAVGMIKATNEGSLITFVNLPGMLRPQSFLFLLILYFVVCIVSYSPRHGNVALSLGVSLIITTITAVISAFVDCFTANGQAGRQSLLSLMADPVNPYDNL